MENILVALLSISSAANVGLLAALASLFRKASLNPASNRTTSKKEDELWELKLEKIVQKLPPGVKDDEYWELKFERLLRKLLEPIQQRLDAHKGSISDVQSELRRFHGAIERMAKRNKELNGE